MLEEAKWKSRLFSPAEMEKPGKVAPALRDHIRLGGGANDHPTEVDSTLYWVTERLHPLNTEVARPEGSALAKLGPPQSLYGLRIMIDEPPEFPELPLGRAAYEAALRQADADVRAGMPRWEDVPFEVKRTWQRAALVDGSPLLREFEAQLKLKP